MSKPLIIATLLIGGLLVALAVVARLPQGEPQPAEAAAGATAVAPSPVERKSIAVDQPKTLTTGVVRAVEGGRPMRVLLAPADAGDPTTISARAMIRKFWDLFVDNAQPTEEQQQAILMAVYDAQLNFDAAWAAELERTRDVIQYRGSTKPREVHGGGDPATWRAQEAREHYPAVALPWREIEADITRRAAEVLDERQLEICKMTFCGARPVMASGKFVQPAQ